MRSDPAFADGRLRCGHLVARGASRPNTGHFCDDLHNHRGQAQHIRRTVVARPMKLAAAAKGTADGE